MATITPIAEDTLERRVRNKMNEEMFKPENRYYFSTSKFEPRESMFFKKDYNRYAVRINDNLIGYISAMIDLDTDVITNLAFISFHPGNKEFVEALRHLISVYLNDYGIRSIIFKCITDSPHVDFCERLCANYCGHKAGTLKGTRRLSDGKFYDQNIYQLIPCNK